MHEVAVLDDVGDAGRRAGVVFQHAEIPGLIAHDIDAADMHVGAESDRKIFHLRPVIRVAEDQIARDDPVLHQFPLVVDVVQEGIDRRNALADAGLKLAPLGCGENTRDAIEREDPVDRGGFGVDRKGDSEIYQIVLRRRRPRPERVKPDRGDAAAQQRGRTRVPLACSRKFTEIRGCIVVIEGVNDRVGHSGNRSWRDRDGA